MGTHFSIKILSESTICEGKTSISEFPKNQALLLVIKGQSSKRRLPSQGISTLKAGQKYAEDLKKSVGSPDEDSSDCNHLTHRLKDYLSTEVETRNQGDYKQVSYKNLSDERESVISSSSVDRCGVHHKKQEILCLIDKVKICSSCALFGNHKNHKVMPLEEAVQKISLKAEQLSLLLKEVSHSAEQVLCESKYKQKIKNTLEDNQVSTLQKIQDLFDVIPSSSHLYKDIEILIEQKRQKLIHEVQKKIKQMEDTCLQSLNDLLSESRRKAELLKTTIHSKLQYYGQKLDMGEIPVDLITRDDHEEQVGKSILKELAEMSVVVDTNVQQLLHKQISVEFKGGFQTYFENLFVLCTKSQQEKQQRDNNILQKMLGTDFNRNEFIIPKNPTSAFPKRQPRIEPVPAVCFEKSNYQSILNRLDQKVSMLETPSDNDAIQPSSPKQRVQKQRSKYSPSPATRNNSKQKMKRINEKFNCVILGIENNLIDEADFSSGDLGDEGIRVLLPLILKSQLKSLKLIKNKITDAGAILLIHSLMDKQFEEGQKGNQVSTINLSNNTITDKIVDAILVKSQQSSSKLDWLQLRHFQFLQNLITNTRVKKKIEELKAMGISIRI